MNYLDEINNGLFKESEHRTKMNIPPQADLLGFYPGRTKFKSSCISNRIK